MVRFLWHKEIVVFLLGIFLLLQVSLILKKPVTVDENGNEQQYSLVAMTLTKNNGPYLPEWLEFHLLQGVDRFVIYDHNSSDNSKAIAQPYIDRGIVEWVKWPEERDTIEATSAFQRDWLNNKRIERFFDLLVHNDCLKLSHFRTIHKQNGCQKAAFLDGVARYRGRTQWITALDIDEFIFLPATSPFASGPAPLARKLDTMKHWVQITIIGRMFGTQGFYDDPPGTSKNLPFSLVTELYRYRAKSPDEWYAKKSFVQPKFVIDSQVHFFTIFKDNLTLSTSTEFLLNHYQRRSLLDCHRKAVENWHAHVEYNSTLDHLHSEVVENDIVSYIPKIKHNLQTALNSGAWKDNDYVLQFPKAIYAKQQSRQKDVCFVVMNFKEPFHHLRRAISTMKLHMDTFEPTVGYEFHSYILPRKDSIYPDITQQNVANYFPDVDAFGGRITVLPMEVSPGNLLTLFADGCEGFSYVVILGEKMETQVAIPGSLSETFSHEIVHDSSIIRQLILLVQDNGRKIRRQPFHLSLLSYFSKNANNVSWQEIPNDIWASKLRYYYAESVNIDVNDNNGIDELQGQLMPLGTLKHLALNCNPNSGDKNYDGLCWSQRITLCFSHNLEKCRSASPPTGLIFSN